MLAAVTLRLQAAAPTGPALSLERCMDVRSVSGIDACPACFGDASRSCCAAGAGKTNIAMLSVLREVGANMAHGIIQKADFKVVYVAPMKVRRPCAAHGHIALLGGGWPRCCVFSMPPPCFLPHGWAFTLRRGLPPACRPAQALAAEVTANFGKRLAPLGLSVRELTGDMQLSKKELAETQVGGARGRVGRVGWRGGGGWRGTKEVAMQGQQHPNAAAAAAAVPSLLPLSVPGLTLLRPHCEPPRLSRLGGATHPQAFTTKALPVPD
jgi:hypothetical protein